jgi:hypothetical protein
MHVPGNFANNGGEVVSHQYNQCSSDYSDRGAQQQSVMMQSQTQQAQLMQQQQLMQHQLMSQHYHHHQPTIMHQMTQNASFMPQPMLPSHMQAMSMPPHSMLYSQGPPPRGGRSLDPNVAAGLTAILSLCGMNNNMNG